MMGGLRMRRRGRGMTDQRWAMRYHLEDVQKVTAGRTAPNRTQSKSWNHENDGEMEKRSELEPSSHQTVNSNQFHGAQNHYRAIMTCARQTGSNAASRPAHNKSTKKPLCSRPCGRMRGRERVVGYIAQAAAFSNQQQARINECMAWAGWKERKGKKWRNEHNKMR